MFSMYSSSYEGKAGAHILTCEACLSVWSVCECFALYLLSYTGLWTLDYSFEICQLFLLPVCGSSLSDSLPPPKMYTCICSLPLSGIRRYMRLSSSDYSDPVERRDSSRDEERGRRGEICQCEKNIRTSVFICTRCSKVKMTAEELWGLRFQNQNLWKTHMWSLCVKERTCSH